MSRHSQPTIVHIIRAGLTWAGGRGAVLGRGDQGYRLWLSEECCTVYVYCAYAQSKRRPPVPQSHADDTLISAATHAGVVHKVLGAPIQVAWHGGDSVGLLAGGDGLRYGPLCVRRKLEAPRRGHECGRQRRGAGMAAGDLTALHWSSGPRRSTRSIRSGGVASRCIIIMSAAFFCVACRHPSCPLPRPAAGHGFGAWPAVPSGRLAHTAGVCHSRRQHDGGEAG